MKNSGQYPFSGLTDDFILVSAKFNILMQTMQQALGNPEYPSSTIVIFSREGDTGLTIDTRKMFNGFFMRARNLEHILQNPWKY